MLYYHYELTTFYYKDDNILLERDKQRPFDCQMHERCLVLLNNFKNMDFDKNLFLNTSNLSIEETIDNIENDNKFFIK